MSGRTVSSLNRRHLLRGALAAGAASALAPLGALPAADTKNGRVKQSIAFWCFNTAGDKWDVEQTCKVAKQLGCPSVELLPPSDWPVLQKYGLVCAMAPNGMPAPPFVKGYNNPRYHDELVARQTEMIDACAAAKFPNVIAFTGYKWRDAEDPKSGEISRDEGAANCIKGLKRIVGHAEKKGVTICVEHLNTRDNTHPMKGHPGYQGDDLDYVSGIIRKVGSPRLKLLFDIYHVQIMHGDLIRRIEQNKDVIGHVHTAGNPGRGELDDTQEINYPAVIKKLVDVGYTGYIGQEFIPTRDPLAGLRAAVQLCNV
jgi:sugar phosphate isomerase/epimerase